MRLVIHVWGAGASLLGLVSWTIASRPESLLLSWLSPILEAEELMLLVPFSLWCWIVVTFVWVLYAVATFLLLSRGILTSYLDVDVDGAGSGVATSNEQQPLIKEVTVSSINKEEEMEQKKKQAERTEQESCVKKVDTEDLSDIGQDKNRAQQQIVTEAPSLRLLCRSASCRQAVDRSSYKGGNSDAIMIKRYRRGPTTTPTKTAHKTWTTSMSLLQQVKHEIQFWSFSLWVLAPTIPRSFDHHQHRPQQQPQQHSTSSNDGKDIRSQAPRHPQQYGPIEKHESLLLTASSSVPCDNMDESEYDMVLSDEASELDRHLASTDVVVATKTEEEEGRRRSQDRQDGGNPGPIQDDGISGSQSVILQTENQPSFGQLQRHSPPTRSGYMSQSMPDLHVVKSTMGPSPVESTLARWSRMTLDSERLGSIFQYYLRQRASTLKKERRTDGYGDHDDQDPTTSDDLHDDASSNNDISNNDDDDDDGADPGVTFVIRSSTLPTVRVGLYSADQKRFWTSSGPTHLSPLPESYV
ncbi:hypothetical protein BGZ89_002834 [Linnemannia elongata]|nr:hypothetical protein BGZ89_002834 [Linnemannia elongata]